MPYYYIPRVPEKATLKAIHEQNPQLKELDIHPDDVAILVEGIYCGAGCGRNTGAGAEGIWWDPLDGVYHSDDIPEDVERVPFQSAGGKGGKKTAAEPKSSEPGSSPTSGTPKKKSSGKSKSKKAAPASTTAGTSSENGSSIGPAIAFLETAYRTFLPLFDGYGDCGLDEITDPVILIQSKGRKNALGWMGPKFWKGDEDVANEISVSAEYLGENSVEEVLGTLLHEMVHHANACWGIKDCSNAQYHNAKFKGLSEHVGLAVEQYAGRGWASTAWTDERLEWTRENLDLKAGAEAFKLARVTRKKEKQPTRMKLWECGCPKGANKIRCTFDLSATCNECGQDYEKKD